MKFCQYKLSQPPFSGEKLSTKPSTFSIQISNRMKFFIDYSETESISIEFDNEDKEFYTVWDLYTDYFYLFIFFFYID